MSTAQDLLYQDQQAAMERRALEEEKLLPKSKELKAPKLKAKAVAKSGTGFGGGASKLHPMAQLAVEQAKVVHRDGVLRVNNVLTPALADKLRVYVLEQQRLASVETEQDPNISRAFYGVENQRKSRCDLQLSLLRGGYAADGGGVVKNMDADSHVVADVLQELLGSDGTLRFLYENLVTLQGEFYELAAVITNPGSSRQQIHPDLPYQDPGPLYVIFLALQDVDESMGPTTFLLKTHTPRENDKFNDMSQKDRQLTTAQPRLSTIQKGDAVLFDARLLHCGNANDPVRGSTRAMFNLSFRNPKITGDLGYAGSIRPGYCGAMNLEDLSSALAAYGSGDKEPFAKYGDGLQKPRSYL